MRYIAQIFSFFVWAAGFTTSFLARFSDVIDDGLSIISLIIGITGGVIWLSILRIKKKNEKLEHEIKKQQLKNLSETEI